MKAGNEGMNHWTAPLKGQETVIKRMGEFHIETYEGECALSDQIRAPKNPLPTQAKRKRKRRDALAAGGSAAENAVIVTAFRKL